MILIDREAPFSRHVGIVRTKEMGVDERNFEGRKDVRKGGKLEENNRLIDSY